MMTMSHGTVGLGRRRARITFVRGLTPRQGEEYLSVNWLEYFGETDSGAAVERVREVFRGKNYQYVRTAGSRCSTSAPPRRQSAKASTDPCVATIYPLLMTNPTPVFSVIPHRIWQLPRTGSAPHTPGRTSSHNLIRFGLEN